MFRCSMNLTAMLLLSFSSCMYECFASPLFQIGETYTYETVSTEAASEVHDGDLVETTTATGTRRTGRVVESSSGNLVKVHFDKPFSSDIQFDLSKDKLYLVSKTEVVITEPTAETIKEAVKAFLKHDPGELAITTPAELYQLRGGCFGPSYQVDGWPVKTSSGDSLVVFRDHHAKWTAGRVSSWSDKYYVQTAGTLVLISRPSAVPRKTNEQANKL